MILHLFATVNLSSINEVRMEAWFRATLTYKNTHTVCYSKAASADVSDALQERSQKTYDKELLVACNWKGIESHLKEGRYSSDHKLLRLLFTELDGQHNNVQH